MGMKEVFEQNPNRRYIMFGGNDSGRPFLVNSGYESYYRQVITTLKRRTRAHVVPVCTIPCGTGNPVMAGFCDVLRKLGGEARVSVCAHRNELER